MDTNSHATAFDGSQVEKHVAISKILTELLIDPDNAYAIITNKPITWLTGINDTCINIAHYTNKKEFDAGMRMVNSDLGRSPEFAFRAFKLSTDNFSNDRTVTEYTYDAAGKLKKSYFVLGFSVESVTLRYVNEEIELLKEAGGVKYSADELINDIRQMHREYPEIISCIVVIYTKAGKGKNLFDYRLCADIEEACSYRSTPPSSGTFVEAYVIPINPGTDIADFYVKPSTPPVPKPPTSPMTEILKPAFKPLSGPEETIFECLHMSLIDMMRRSKPAGSPFTLLEITGMIGTILQNADIDKYASLAKFYVSIDLVKLLNPFVKSEIVGFKFHDSEETMDKHFLNNLAYRFHKGDVAKYCLTFSESASNVFNLEYLGVVSVLGLELEMDDSADRALDQSKANTKNNARLEFMRYCSDVTMLLNSFYLHIKPVGHEYSSSFNACNIVDKVQYVFQVHRESLPENGVLIKHSVDFNNYYLEFTIKNTNGKISLMGYMSCKGLKDTELEAIISNYLFDDKLPTTAIVL
jgi:hypothetical protein